MHVYYKDPNYFQQLSLFDEEKLEEKTEHGMTVGGVKANLLDIQQFLVGGIGNFYGTTIKVQTVEPLPVNTDSLSVSGAPIETLNGAEFYIGSMYYKPGAYYIYSLVGVRLLPRI